MSPSCPTSTVIWCNASPEHAARALARIEDPLARLLDASLLVMRQEADAATLSLATETASAQGWRQPLLTYLKLQEKQAAAQGNAAEQARLARRIQLVEQSLSPPMNKPSDPQAHSTITPTAISP